MWLFLLFAFIDDFILEPPLVSIAQVSEVEALLKSSTHDGFVLLSRVQFRSENFLSLHKNFLKFFKGEKTKQHFKKSDSFHTFLQMKIPHQVGYHFLSLTFINCFQKTYLFASHHSKSILEKEFFQLASLLKCKG